MCVEEMRHRAEQKRQDRIHARHLREKALLSKLHRKETLSQQSSQGQLMSTQSIMTVRLSLDDDHDEDAISKPSYPPGVKRPFRALAGAAPAPSQAGVPTTTLEGTVGTKRRTLLEPRRNGTFVAATRRTKTYGAINQSEVA